MKRAGLLKTDNHRAQQPLVGGFLNIDKPAGWTSHDVVAKLRPLLKMKRVGHLGTLDPQATGVLPICFGKGTKLASFLNNSDKAYDAVLRLGEETDTEDATGKVTRTTDIPDALKGKAGEAVVRTALLSFIGPYMQEPPMYSAIKMNGVPLYKIARSGKVVERTARPVTIHDISFSGMHGTDVVFKVTCSKGTYIRTLCFDIGRKLGVGAHLFSLRRTRAGDFHLENSVDLDSFSAHCQDGDWQKCVYPLDQALSDFPSLTVKASQVSRVLNGVQIGFEGLERWESFEKDEPLRFLDPEGSLIAVGQAHCHTEDTKPSSGFEQESPFRIKTVLGT